MDITQILLGIGAVVGIIIVCVLAIVPTVMSLPLPERQHRPPLHPIDGTHRRGGPPTNNPTTNHHDSVDLAA